MDCPYTLRSYLLLFAHTHTHTHTVGRWIDRYKWVYNLKYYKNGERKKGSFHIGTVFLKFVVFKIIKHKKNLNPGAIAADMPGLLCEI
jgi:hypothetical protein